MILRARAVKSNRVHLTAQLRTSANRALVETAEDALSEANDRVPYEEGHLARSGEVTAFPEQLKVAITYDTDYAVKQHEDPTLHHPRQGEHHWLENTVEQNSQRYFAHIADSIRKGMS